MEVRSWKAPIGRVRRRTSRKRRSIGVVIGLTGPAAVAGNSKVIRVREALEETKAHDIQIKVPKTRAPA